jgi:hypothetical protein
VQKKNITFRTDSKLLFRALIEVLVFCFADFSSLINGNVAFSGSTTDSGERWIPEDKPESQHWIKTYTNWRDVDVFSRARKSLPVLALQYCQRGKAIYNLQLNFPPVHELVFNLVKLSK